MIRLEALHRVRALVDAELEREPSHNVRRLRAWVDGEIAAEQHRNALSESGAAALIESAADLYGVDIHRLMSGARDAQTARARQAACWVLRQRGLTLTQIARLLDRDHTTVMYACRVVEQDRGRRALLRRLLFDQHLDQVAS